MFDAAEIGHKLDKKTFEREAPKLRELLLDAQFDLAENKAFPVIVLVAGLAGAGKGETVNLLTEWMDPRRIDSVANGAPTDEERERPFMWRFWRNLPPKGRTGIFFHSWYQDPVDAMSRGKIGRADFDQRIEDIQRFERMLADEGALVLKFWLHLSKKKQRKTLAKLESKKSTCWRVTKADWKEHKRYDDVVAAWRHAIRLTSLSHAPWTVIEAGDREYRLLTVARGLATALRQRLDHPRRAPGAAAPMPLPPVDGKRLIDTLDLSLGLGEKDYDKRRDELQGRLSKLTRHRKFKERGAVLVFEGSDAAGKGGAIRRVAGGLDVRHYRIIPIAAPSDEERDQPYLWRFWRHLPRNGHVAIFDRSWYGRVLVERVEGFAAQDDWLRAYGEINDFEDAMVRDRLVVAKFWLAISAKEQLRRFKEREATGFKRYKITPDDWRNRKKWDAYIQAANDMVERTSTGLAPWTLIEAEDKNYARIKILETICDKIEAALD